MDDKIEIIGRIRTPFATGAECPRHGEESETEGMVEIFPQFAPGLHSLVVGQEVTLLTWLHKADRGVLSTHPRGDLSRPARGVFNTRSPARPNPLGLHDVRILEIRPAGPDGIVQLRVSNVDMMDGTPLVDIKSSFAQRSGATTRDTASATYIDPAASDARGPVGSFLPQIEAIIEACRDAWQRALFSGFNGNVSMRIGASCLITRTGCVKATLRRTDFAVLDMASGKQIAGAPASSEAAMHCAVYRRMPKIDAIAHTHPPHLLALEQRNMGAPGPDSDTPASLFQPHANELFERGQMLRSLGWVRDFAPGSQDLAEAVAEAARRYPAIWMHRHGLVCCGGNPGVTLALAEELEHLARVELLQS